MVIVIMAIGYGGCEVPRLAPESQAPSLFIPLSSLTGCYPGDVSHTAEQFLGGLCGAARQCELVSRPQTAPHPSTPALVSDGHAVLAKLFS